jgi:hypothetical protein
MGEAKRKGALQKPRTWATGLLKIVANESDCFEWTGTRQDAVDLQKRYLATANMVGCNPHSYASRVAGYLMAFGMPRAGDIDQRPSRRGDLWTENEIALCRAALLWTALREPVPGSGQKVEDLFVGKALVVVFNGDKARILNETARELSGQPFSGEQFTMTVGVLDNDHKLDPAAAIGIDEARTSMGLCSRLRALVAAVVEKPRLRGVPGTPTAANTRATPPTLAVPRHRRSGSGAVRLRRDAGHVARREPGWCNWMHRSRSRARCRRPRVRFMF